MMRSPLDRHLSWRSEPDPSSDRGSGFFAADGRLPNRQNGTGGYWILVPFLVLGGQCHDRRAAG